MPYVTIPKDLTKVKSKVLFNLTKRQLVCFSAGLLVGVPLFFLTKEPLGNSTAALLMILTMLPAFMLALYEKNGQHLEVIIRNMVARLQARNGELKQQIQELENLDIVSMVRECGMTPEQLSALLEKLQLPAADKKEVFSVEV